MFSNFLSSMVKTWEKRVGDPSILHMNEFTDDLKTKYPIYLLQGYVYNLCHGSPKGISEQTENGKNGSKNGLDSEITIQGQGNNNGRQKT